MNSVQPDITAQQPSAKSSRGRIKAPAVGLMVQGLVISLVSGGCLLYFLKVHADPQTNIGLSDMAKHIPILFSIFYIAAGVGILIGMFVIVGGIQMFRIRNYGLALTASIVSFPAAVFTFWPSVPIGIWALVVLVQPAVRNEFARPVT